jgi:Mn2+/Fe2+ NRAMP family transporter
VFAYAAIVFFAKIPEQARSQFLNIRLDTCSGMAVSNLVMYFIILTTAMTLHVQHVTDIQTAEQAARAVEPIAARFAFMLFAVGMIGTGLLAIPSLAGLVDYAMGEAFKWPTGLVHEPYRAKRFYFVIAASTLIGAAMNFVGIDPIKALIGSTDINGI